MKHYAIFIVTSLFLFGCSSTEYSEDVYGTWRLSTVNGEPLNSEFYMKLSRDGIAEYLACTSMLEQRVDF